MSVEAQHLKQPQDSSGTLPFWRQLRWSLIMYFVLLAVIPASIVVAVTLSQTSAQARKRVANELESVAQLKTNEIELWLRQVQNSLAVLQAGYIRSNRFITLTTKPVDSVEFITQRRALNGIFADARVTAPELLDVFYYNQDGIVLASSNPARLNNVVLQQPYYTPSLSGERYVQPPFYEVGSSDLTQIITQPVLDATGTQIGVLAARVNLDQLGIIMLERTGLGDSGETYLVSTQYNYFLTPSRFEGYPQNRAYHSTGIDRALQGESGSATYTDYRNHKVIGAYQWVPELQAAMLAEVDESEALATFTEAQRFSIGLTVVAALLAVGVGLWAATRVSNPIIALTGFAGQIAGGDLRQRAPVMRRNEIGMLASAFNVMASQLQEVIDSLENRVASRTRDLFLTLEVGQLATQIYEREDLLQQVVDFVHKQFDLYYAQVYLLDDAQRYAVLAAGTGEVGEQLMDRKHRLDLRETSIVARTVQSRRPVLVVDTQTSDIHKANPLLPDTRSEVSIPLIVGNQILGVMDLQSGEVGKFNEDNQPVFEAMASQLAAALSSARSFRETQIAVERAAAINRRLTEAAWESYVGRLSDGKPLAYHYDLQTVEPLNGGSDTALTGHDGAVSRPVLVRNQPIGTISVTEDVTREWEPEELELIDQVAERVAQTLEQFRAFDETQAALEQTETLYNASRRLIMASDPDALLAAFVAPMTHPDKPYDAALMYVDTNEEGQPEWAEVVATVEGTGSAPATVGTRIHIPEYPIGGLVLAHSEHALVIGDVENHPAVDAHTLDALNQMGLQALVIVPMKLGGSVSGYLTASWPEKRTFSAEEEQLFNVLGPQAAALIENQRLLTQSHQRASEMQAVADVGIQTSTILDVSQLLRDVSNLTKERFNLYHAQVYLFDSARQFMQLVAGAGQTGEKMVSIGHRIPMSSDRSLVVTAARTSEAVIANNVASSSDFLPNPMLPRTQSEMAVPLIAGNTVIGVLDVQSEIANRFNEQDIQVNTTLAAQIASAVQTARLFAESEEQAHHMALLNEMSTEMSAASTVDDVYRIVAAKTDQIFDSDRSSIAFLDETGTKFEIFGLDGIKGAIPVGAMLPTEGTLLGDVMRQRRIVRTSDIRTMDFIETKSLVSQGLVSSMNAPLMFGDEFIGLLNVASKQPDAYDSRAEALFQQIVSLFVSHLQNQRLLEQTQRRAAELQAVAEVSAETARVLDLHQLLIDVSNLTKERFDLYHAHIYLMDDEGKRLVLSAGAGSVGEILTAAKHQIGVNNATSLVARAARTREGVIVNDVTKAPDFLPNPLLPDTRSEMAVPMVAGNTLIGVLDIQDDVVSRFRDDDVQIMTTLAAQVASAVQNAQLFTQSAQRLAIIDNADDVIALANMNGVVEYINPAGVRVLGYDSAEEMLGKTIVSYQPPEAAQLSAEETIPTVMQSGSWRGETELLRKDGTHIPVEQTVLLIRDEQDRPQFLATIVTDITERKAAQVEREKLLAETSALYDASRRVTTATTEQELIAAVVESINISSINRALVFSVETDIASQTANAVQVTSNWFSGVGDPPSEVGRRYDLAEYPAMRFALSSGPVYFNDTLNDPRVDAELYTVLEAQQIRAMVILPLIAGDRRLGALYLQSEEPHYFTDDEVRPFMSIAGQMAVALDSMRLFEQAQKRAAEMQAVAEVGAEASASLDSAQLLWTVANLTKERFDLYHAHIYLMDSTGSNLVLGAGAGTIGRQMVDLGHRIPTQSERSLVARAARTREAVVVNNVRAVPDHLPNPQLPRTRSEMAIPMIAGDTVIGVLDVQSQLIGRFAENDIQVLSTLSTQISVAVQNARLFEESSQRLAIIENADDMIALADMEGTVQYMNPAGIQMLGYTSAEDVLGQPLNNYQPPEALERGIKEAIPTVMETGMWRAETELLKSDGTVIPVEQTVLLIRDEQERPRFLATIASDITERKAAQEALDRQNRTMQALLENLPVGVFMVDAATGNPLIANTAAANMLGRGIMPVSETDELAEVYAAYLAGTEEPYPTEQMPLVRGMMGEHARIDNMAVRRPDGTEVLLEVLGAPIRDAQDNIVSSVAVFQDITERRKQEEIIRQRAAEMQTVAEVGTEASTTLDPDKLLWNVTNLVKDQFDLYHAHIYLLDRSENLILAAGAGDVGRRMVTVGHRIPLNSEVSLVARTARSREGVTVNDVTLAADFMANPMLPDTRSEMAVPMITGDTLIGVLDVQSQTVGRFTQDEIQVMSTLAAQIAVAVQNARQFNETQLRVRDLQALGAVMDLVRSDEDLEPMLEKVIDVVVAAFGADHGAITRLNHTSQIWSGIVGGTSGLITSSVKAFHDPGSYYPVGMDAVQANKIVAVDDVANYPNFPQSILESLDLKSTIAIPVQTTPDYTDILSLNFTSQTHHFTPEEIQLAGSLADQIAGGIERKVAEERLRQANLVVENSPAMLFQWGAETGWKVELASENVAQLGYAASDLIAGHMLYSHLVHPDDLPQLEAQMNEHIASGDEMGSFQYRVITKDGAIRWVEESNTILRDEDGTYTGSQGLVLDITDRKAAELALREREEQFRTLFEQSNDAIYLLKADGTFADWNKQTLVIYGAEPEDLEGKTPGDFSPPAQPDGSNSDEKAIEYIRMAAEGARQVFEWVHTRKDGTIFWADVSLNVVEIAGQTYTQATVRDTTERREAERERREQQQLLRTIIDSTPDWIFVKDQNFRYQMVNKGFAEALGRTPDEIVGMSDYDMGFPTILIEGDPKQNIVGFRPSDTQVLTGETITIPSDPIMFADGKIHILDMLKSPLRDSEGNVISLLGVGHDVTEREQLLNEVQQASFELSERLKELAALQDVGQYGEENLALEEYLTRVANRLPASMQHPDICVAAIDYRDEIYGSRKVLDVSNKLTQPLTVGSEQVGTLMIGYSKEVDFMPEEIPHIREIANRVSTYLENRQLLEQTQKRATEMQTVAEVGAEAASSLEQTRLLQNVSDLTKERFGLYHAHVYLLDEESNNLVLAAGSGQAGHLMVQAGHRIPLNRQNSVVAQAARTAQPVIVNNVSQAGEFLPNPLLPQTKSEMSVPMIAGNTVIGVLDVQASEINRFTEEDMRIQSTLASQVAVAIQNAQLYAEQVETTEQLREVDRLKSEFLASMSHELRTPLNSIIGYAEVLLDGIDGDLTADMEEDVGAIHGSGKLLLNLINDILDLAKIEAGQMDLVTEDFSFKPVAEDMINTAKVLIMEKQVEMVIDIPDDLPQVHGDALRVRQVINNILSNAAKFTEEGDITFRAMIDPDDPKMLHVTVKDSGIGMTQEQTEVIFDRFRQVDQSHTRRAGGTGLGLSITQQLIEMHGGQIWVESVYGQGSTFHFTIPLAEES